MKIKFIKYTGAYPNLCSGVLTLEINGKAYAFGGYGEPDDYPKFWESGGSCGWIPDEWCIQKPWILNEAALPDWLKPYGEQLIKVFNKNVPHGCCGGCI